MDNWVVTPLKKVVTCFFFPFIAGKGPTLQGAHGTARVAMLVTGFYSFLMGTDLMYV